MSKIKNTLFCIVTLIRNEKHVIYITGTDLFSYLTVTMHTLACLKDNAQYSLHDQDTDKRRIGVYLSSRQLFKLLVALKIKYKYEIECNENLIICTHKTRA